MPCLKSETRQPRFHLKDPVALDLDGPAGANPNGVLARVFGNRDLQGRPELVQEFIAIARYLFDPGGDPGTVLSIFRIHGQKSHRVVGFVLCSSHRKGVFPEPRPVVTERGIPPVRKNLWFRNDRLDRGFGNESLVGVVFVVVPQSDSAPGGVLFEESLDLPRRMFGSGRVVVVFVVIEPTEQRGLDCRDARSGSHRSNGTDATNGSGCWCLCPRRCRYWCRCWHGRQQ